MVVPTRPWPKPHRTAREFAIYNAQVNMMKSVNDIKTKLWWKFMRHTDVVVKWPVGWAILHDDGKGGITSTESADPNDHYRPWLEANVGKQCWDWNWEPGPVAAVSDDGSDLGCDTVRIALRKKQAHFASIIALKWA